MYEFVWHTVDGLPPRDTPKCGLFNEMCRSVPTGKTIDLYKAVGASSVNVYTVCNRRTQY